MKVNDFKTQMLCFLAAKNTDVSSYNCLENGERIEGQDKLKLLGKPNLDNRMKHPKLNPFMLGLVSRTLVLCHLIAAGCNEQILFLFTV